MSQFLMRIEELLRSESNPTRLAELNAQKAGYLARVGSFDEARDIIKELRVNLDDGHDAIATVWLMIAEGLLRLYEDLNSDAYDRFKRAYFISRNIIKSNRLVSITCAWKSHIEFERSAFEEMFVSLAEFKQIASDHDLSALTRYAIVVCECFALCGQFEQSQKWFLKAREYALKDGDRVSLEALVYNKAAFRLAWYRSNFCFGVFDEKELNRIRSELNSAINFQTLIDVSAHQNFSYLCQTRVDILQGKFDIAKEKLEKVRDMAGFADYNFDKKYIALELSYCLAKCGNLEAGLSYKDHWQDIDLSRLDLDEQLFGRWMILKLSECDKAFGPADSASQLFDIASVQYKNQLDKMNLAMKEYFI